ncbi:aKG-HExxH-type peptide beta-hydroxylase [Mangrovihabitans endophyticus]|uniref:HEXXH motif-containing protein n=1 Tax=Mangrovihabitans endophyticus TaxID=1751298 RepID=A0A8J3FMW7_9ACTN|nr:HEXXH motif-containing putative peptide modification protein [Mangrovihabitans endophyticus]GGK86847.1 hypothetical protein GCM10012284_21240 [Mangrovihabitans endophyticus]
MHPHTLTDAAFAALGAGRSSAPVHAELRRAQLGKHLLLLSRIARIDPSLVATGPDTQTEQHAAVLTDPMTGLWATTTLAALRAGRAPESPGYLGGRLAEAPRRTITASHRGLTATLRIEDTSPLRARLGLRPADRLTDGELAHWQACLSDAWPVLVDRHRTDAETIAGMLGWIIPVLPDSSVRGISATSADAFGAVALSTPADGRSLAVALVHEAQHNVLNAVQYLFDLHRTPDARGYSPWRADPRPASGILHGTYAYLALTRFWRTEFRHADDDAVAAFEFARWRDAVAGSAAEMLDSGVLTTAGARFVGALRDEADGWRADTVPPPIARLAAEANLDHRLRWRLRNLAVHPGDAHALAAAWRHAAPAPAMPEAGLTTGRGRVLDHSTRLDLVHRSLRTPGSATDEATMPPGERAYLAGDLDAAAVAFADRIRADATDHEAWTGLALTTSDPLLTDRVEIVAAAYRETAEPRLDPRAFAAWLAG